MKNLKVTVLPRRDGFSQLAVEFTDEENQRRGIVSSCFSHDIRPAELAHILRDWARMIERLGLVVQRNSSSVA